MVSCATAGGAFACAHEATESEAQHQPRTQVAIRLRWSLRDRPAQLTYVYVERLSLLNTTSGRGRVTKTMPGERGVVAKTYASARREHRAATIAADAAYERLLASPDTIEYQVEWNVARRHEAATASRLKQAKADYEKAGRHLGEDRRTM